MTRKYPDELRAEVVNAVIEGGMTYAGAARRFGMADETVKAWVIAARQGIDAFQRALDATNRERIADLERRLDELERDNARVERAVHVVSGLVDVLRTGWRRCPTHRRENHLMQTPTFRLTGGR